MGWPVTHVYIAYKRADLARVTQLAEALTAAGIHVWYDQELPGSESWRASLEMHHREAGCILAVWSIESTGPDNHWVLEEASPAIRAGKLVQIRIDNARPPFGFRELQCLDLSHWRGNPRYLALQDVIEAVDAKLKGEPAPVPQWPRRRTQRLLARYGVSSAAVAAALSLVFNTFGAATRVCTVPGLQPGLSDLCGSIGLGGRPSQAERLAWEALPPHDCEALGAHIRAFPHGVHALDANNLLTAGKVSQVITWMPAERPLPFTELVTDAPSANLAAARKAAIAHAVGRMEEMCRGLAISGHLFRYRGLGPPVVREWSCQNLPAGTSCGWSGDAVCKLLESTIHETVTY